MRESGKLKSQIKKLKLELSKLKLESAQTQSLDSIIPRTIHSYHSSCTSDMFAAKSQKSALCLRCKSLLSLGFSTSSCKEHQNKPNN